MDLSTINATEAISVVYSKTVVLDKPAKWDLWIYQTETSARGLGIWDYVNPDLLEKPLPLAKPEYKTPLQTAIAYPEDTTD